MPCLYLIYPSKPPFGGFLKQGYCTPNHPKFHHFIFEIHGLAPFEETPISFGDSRVFPTEFAGLEPLSGSLVLGSFISRRQARPFSPNVGPQNFMSKFFQVRSCHAMIEAAPRCQGQAFQENMEVEHYYLIKAACRPGEDWSWPEVSFYSFWMLGRSWPETKFRVAFSLQIQSVR